MCDDGYRTHRGVWTSVLAAEQAEGFKPIVEGMILKYLEMKGEHGATDEELYTVLDCNQNTVRPRRVCLVRQGLVKDSGRWRFTKAKRSAIVWVLDKYYQPPKASN